MFFVEYLCPLDIHQLNGGKAIKKEKSENSNNTVKDLIKIFVYNRIKRYKGGDWMFYVTIFQIVSEMKVSQTIFQEVEKRYLKSFESYIDAKAYLHAIQNRKLMYNYPMAVIGEYDPGKRPKIKKQTLYKYYPTNNDYLEIEGNSGIVASTLTMLHPFEGSVLFDSDMV